MNSFIDTYPSLPPLGTGSVFSSWSNPCSGCLYLWELLMVYSVLSLSVSHRATEVPLGPLSWPALLVLSIVLLSWPNLCSCSLCYKVPFLVLSMQLQPMFQDSSLGPLSWSSLCSFSLCLKFPMTFQQRA